jgi:hypothetical protein
MDTTASGIVIDVRPEQFKNAKFAIDVTDSGIVINLRPEHP